MPAEKNNQNVSNPKLLWLKSTYKVHTVEQESLVRNMTNHFVGSGAAFYLPGPFFFGHGSMCSNLGGGTFHAHTL